MLAIADLLQQPSSSRFRVSGKAADAVYVHLACPKRRALIKAIGLGEVPVGELRARYGQSWGSVQGDLRALVGAGYVLTDGLGADEVLCLDLGAFPLGMLENLVEVPQRRVLRREVARVAA